MAAKGYFFVARKVKEGKERIVGNPLERERVRPQSWLVEQQ